MLNTLYFRKSNDECEPKVGPTPHLLWPILLGLTEGYSDNRLGLPLEKFGGYIVCSLLDSLRFGRKLVI